jgi:photosystem II stability/assembly factor-like uncharacterized protein
MPKGQLIWHITAVCLLLAEAAHGDGPSLVVTDKPVTVAQTMQNDASLVDVAFVDPATGWAVGDRGTIWHTSDGGESWALQPSGVTCSLACVSFVDTQHGWIAGGEVQPLSSASRGVLLTTGDGGRSWQELDQPTLPALRQLRFFDIQHGIAAGDSSPLYPSGVCITQDGGRSWQPLPTDAAHDWLAADFPDPRSGAVAGAGARFATLVRRRVVNSPVAADGMRAYRAMQLLPPTDGWLVGDGGLVMTTRDLGASWQTPPGPLPNVARENFDFCAVAAAGPQVWVAGAPGTRVLHSADGGQTWRLVPTGQSAPLRSIMFVDETTGFAVGDLGTILRSRDGGRSWHLQRRGGARAALFVVTAREADVPLELLGKLGAEEAYLTAVSVLHPARPTDDERTTAALLSAGATSTDATWRFPLADVAGRSPQELFEELNRANDGRAVERVQKYLVRELRTWRPDVVVTHLVAQPESEPLGSLVEQMMNQALVAAADPNQHIELSDELGLTPWHVKKTYGLLPNGSRSIERIPTGEFAPRLGTTLADWAEPARRILGVDAAAPDGIDLLVTMADASATSASSQGVFAGIQLAPGSEARRLLANLPTDDVERLRRLATRRRQMRMIVEKSQGNDAWAAQVAHLTDDLDPASAGELMFELASAYRAAGKLDLAADTYSSLARQWPDHPLVDPALRWLVQFYASSEAAIRLADRNASNYRLPVDSAQPQFGNVRQASAIEMLKANAAPMTGLSRDDRLQRAAAVGQYLEQSRPAVFAEPAIRFPLVGAQRQRGFANPAQRYFLTLRSLPENDPWRRCGATEEWFVKPEGLPPPKKLGNCRRTNERPHLDGKLDEAMWEAADRLVLLGPNDLSVVAQAHGGETGRIAHPTVRLVRDDEFLYICVECQKAEDIEYPDDDTPRTRDAKLASYDRISLRLDVDRDYTTAFELTVDARGWTNDACWGDATWNPKWFVAAGADESSWRIEAAIPLAELAAAPPTTKDVWALCLMRTIPGDGQQTWAGDAAAPDSPDKFGLLIFE